MLPKSGFRFLRLTSKDLLRPLYFGFTINMFVL